MSKTRTEGEYLRHTKHHRYPIWRLVACSALFLSGSMAARAQSLEQYIPLGVSGSGDQRGVTVLSRARPEYDTFGIRLGNIVIRPLLTESMGYESNVFGTKSPVGSALLETNASLSAASDWSRNSISASVAVDDLRYIDQPLQSYTNWNASISGIYEVGKDLISSQYQHSHLNQTTLGLDVPQLGRPLGYDIDSLSMSYRWTLNRLSVTPTLNISNYNFTNGVANGLFYLQNYRDRTAITPGVALSYELSPRRTAVIIVRNSSALYRNRPDGAPQRNYNNTSVLAGLEYDLTGITRFRVLGGYETRVFKDASYKTIQAPIIEASVIWMPTGLTTITGSASRHVQDTADEATAAFTQTSVSIAIDHEYLRDILLRGGGAVNFGEYSQGSHQSLYSASMGVTYFDESI